MEFLKKLMNGKDKKTVVKLACFFTLGIGLLVFSRWLSPSLIPGETEILKETGVPASPSLLTDKNYEEQLEGKLEKMFSLVEGAGKVKVMITLAASKEMVVAKDETGENSATIETDQAGGKREVNSSKSSGQSVILKNSDGSSEPLIVKEKEPVIEGVIIVAEGGGNIYVKDALIRAARAVLGVEANKIEVLKMKT